MYTLRCIVRLRYGYTTHLDLNLIIQFEYPHPTKHQAAVTIVTDGRYNRYRQPFCTIPARAYTTAESLASLATVTDRREFLRAICIVSGIVL